ncbi:hypothetical protein ACFQ4C_30330 [Larkinella insperata]|uniref:CopG family transcriptional regulator n=1 Tax=Larkinella insperata TaxID=332158 RepID=A0ABW3QH80_9BACT
MAVSLAPPKRKPSEADIEAVINKGGQPTTQPPAANPDKPKHINIRLNEDIISRIERLRAKRPRKPGSPKLGISTHDWIVEAVLDKLRKEEK